MPRHVVVAGQHFCHALASGSHWGERESLSLRVTIQLNTPCHVAREPSRCSANMLVSYILMIVNCLATISVYNSQRCQTGSIRIDCLRSSLIKKHICDYQAVATCRCKKECEMHIRQCKEVFTDLARSAPQ